MLKNRNMVVDLVKSMEMSVGEQEHGVTYKNDGRSTHVDRIVY